MTTFNLKTKTGALFTADIDVAKLPAASIERAIRIGITNVLRDSYAGDKDDKARRESFDRALKHLLDGTAPDRGRTTDPVATEAKRLAVILLRQKGIKPDADGYKEALAKVAANDKVLAKARANVEAVSGLDIDI